MKKSQLKEAIKNKIISVLSEEMTDKERESKLQQAKRGGGKEKPLRKLAAIGKKEDEKKLKEGVWSSGTYNEIGRFLQDIKNLKDKYYDIVGSDDVYDGLDRAEESAREMMINAPENRSDITEDEEPTNAELKKADSVASTANKLQKLVKKMKSKAKEFKSSEGKAKDKIKDELKKMTAEKKKLEKSL